MSATNETSIPTTGTRSVLDQELDCFLKSQPSLHLGGDDKFTDERRNHAKVFGIHNLPKDRHAPIHHVEFTALRGPHGTIPVRVLYPSSGEGRKEKGQAGALIYFHGGGYTVGTVDEFENGLRIVAEESGLQIYAVEYRLAPEYHFPTQLDEYACVLENLRSTFGASRGVHPDSVLGGGDSAGGNMTAAISLRLRDEGKKPLAGQILLYPEARLPFDTPAASENNTGLYLECNGIFSFGSNYLPLGTVPSHPYVSPGMQPISSLKDLPPAHIYTCGFDPLRDVGIEYAHKLERAGNTVKWTHFGNLTHGFLQLAPWSEEAMKATKEVGKHTRNLVYS
ncbi:hypothetical protein SERLA73DRAFT_188494 [Serpula lacrymans var. lacrymans S7.3]|uniref:Alpha/beta hydrolase fold-3 domain-containing protein n=2 Tax=Serpula lacrymans var. lacrymans TaxID=341189 RepID=F8QBE8_SERL3|nr:uncharacterized protein SERLADRAFT_358375 [Serpula lacrymans var. lacrymans S7.9]EGN94534.1 hypothetical protein SERLA73DRAFT_188494 [Serpula lacrymans var. lacrymans S7.3]EGO20015.1 hypothetical protein SERLADRAFT_358375 [Serpula lacrymans var. lacrymans S7.9]